MIKTVYLQILSVTQVLYEIQQNLNLEYFNSHLHRNFLSIFPIEQGNHLHQTLFLALFQFEQGEVSNLQLNRYCVVNHVISFYFVNEPMS